MLAISLLESLKGRPASLFAIEVIGFSEEEGMRFGVPFIGSRWRLSEGWTKKC